MLEPVGVGHGADACPDEPPPRRPAGPSPRYARPQRARGRPRRLRGRSRPRVGPARSRARRTARAARRTRRRDARRRWRAAPCRPAARPGVAEVRARPARHRQRHRHHGADPRRQREVLRADRLHARRADRREPPDREQRHASARILRRHVAHHRRGRGLARRDLQPLEGRLAALGRRVDRADGRRRRATRTLRRDPHRHHREEARRGGAAQAAALPRRAARCDPGGDLLQGRARPLRRHEPRAGMAVRHRPAHGGRTDLGGSVLRRLCRRAHRARPRGADTGDAPVLRDGDAAARRHAAHAVLQQGVDDRRHRLGHRHDRRDLRHHRA